MGGNTPDQQVTTVQDKGGNTLNTNNLATGATSDLSKGTSYGTTQGSTLTNTSGQTTVNIPDWLKPLVMQGTGAAGGALTNLTDLTNAFEVPPETLAALRSTAGGDYLFGGPQQQAFVDAALRTAAPGVISAFGGRATGGLARAALNQQGVDAFAGLFNNERDRQLAAAQALPGFAAMPLELQRQLLASASSVPSSFAPFLGQNTQGITYGQNYGTNYGYTTGENTGTSRQQSTGSQIGTTNNMQTQTQPLYQTPWWQTALGAGTALAGLAMPGLSGVSAIGNIIGGAKGLLGTTR